MGTAINTDYLNELERDYNKGEDCIEKALNSFNKTNRSHKFKVKKQKHNKINNKVSVLRITWDYKNGAEASEGIISATKNLGLPLYVYPDLNCEGSDSFGFIISKKPLSENKIQKYSDTL